MIRIIRSLIVVLIPLIAVMLGIWVSPAFHIRLLALFGRTANCPLGQVVAGCEQHLEHETKIKQISTGIRLLSEEPGGLALFHTRHGDFWMSGTNDRLLAHLLAEQEANIYGAGSDGVRPGDVVLDCGAHVGVFTREALKAGAKLVVAIEPAPENLVCLRRNLESEIAANKVIVVDEGVWDKEDYLILLQSDNTAGDHFDPDHADAAVGPKVHLTTIDELAARLKLERVDFIKMDIEGSEQRAIVGARRTIQAYRPRLAIASYHRADDPEKIPAILRSVSPGYVGTCGICTATLTLISPEILLFRHTQAL